MSTVATAPRPFVVPVDGGDLAGGEWSAPDGHGPPVLALHGITANHRCFSAVAGLLPRTRVVVAGHSCWAS